MNTLKKIALVCFVAGFALAGNIVRADEHEGAAEGADSAMSETTDAHGAHAGTEKPMKKAGAHHAKKEKVMKKAHNKKADKKKAVEETTM